MKLSAKQSEISRFLLVGGIAVLIDLLTYYLLVTASLLSPQAAKRVSFVLGASWAFVGNKFFTFKAQGKTELQISIFVIVYLLTGLANSVSHDLTLQFFGLKWFAFLFATGVSTVLNYLLQKYLVFR